MNEEKRKVKYNITKFTKKGNFRFYGYGEIDNKNLYTSYTDRNGNVIEHTYENCIKDCHRVLNTTDQFKGAYSEFEEIEFVNEKKQRVNLEIEVCYQIWFRILA